MKYGFIEDSPRESAPFRSLILNNKISLAQSFLPQKKAEESESRPKHFYRYILF
jgi:hypothetical protein